MAITTAAIMISMSSAMPIAVMIEFEREHQVDHDQLDHDPERTTLARGGASSAVLVARLDLGVDFVRRLGDQEQPAADQDDVAPRYPHAEHGDERLRSGPSAR